MAIVEVHGFKVNHFKETPGLCGPATLTMLINALGVGPLTEMDLVQLCGPDRVTTQGTNHQIMEGVTQSFLPNSRVLLGWPLKQLAQIEASLVAINFMNGPDANNHGHYAVYRAWGEKHIELIDPEVVPPTLKRPYTRWLEDHFFDIDPIEGWVRNWALVVSGRVSI